MKPNLHLATPQVPAEIERVEYVAVTARGVPIVPMTLFPDRASAVKWLTKADDAGRSPLDYYPGATIIERTHYAPAERTVWRERVLKVVSNG